jgi:hypothetical protein
VATTSDTTRSNPAICPVCWDLKAGHYGCHCDRADLPYPDTMDEREARIGPWLCHTCQLEIVPGRGRWTMLHCPTCKARVIELNAAAGGLVIPVGIHSLTNQVATRLDAPDEEIARFVSAMGGMVSVITWLDQYCHDRIRRLCEDLGLDTAAPIGHEAFRRACADAGLTHEAAFAELVTARADAARHDTGGAGVP